MLNLISAFFIINAFAAPSPTPSNPFNQLQPGTMAELISKVKDTDWRKLDPENSLYLELKTGRVIIELNPDFAPESVANIKKLAAENYWDGLAIIRVMDNYVVQWGDPNAEDATKRKKIKTAKEKIAAELDVTLNTKTPFTKFKDKDVYAPAVGFSNGFAVGQDPAKKKMWMLHCYGAVGVGRDVAPDSGNGAELYTVIGNAPRHLDRNVTVVGRVIQGVEFLSSLPRGHAQLGFYEKPEQHVPIQSIRLASQVSEKERTNLEVLRTDTPFFQKYVEARRNRKEYWFHYRSGHIDVCNVPVPVREVK